MRPTIFAGLVSLFVQTAALAQTGPYFAVVADGGTKLRAGPSDKFPETATLPKGFQILVDHEEDGWLAVQDVPGRVNSVSWVQNQFVNFDKNSPIPQLVEVFESGTTLRAGQIGVAQPLSVQKAKIPGGTILTIIGKGVEFEGKTWYPVVPPAGDFRYVPKQAVTTQKTANTAFSVRESIPEKSLPPAIGSGTPATPTASIPGSGAGTLLPPGGPVTPVGNKTTQNPLWAQAEAAEREGRYDDAEKLYFQLARAMNEPGGDHDIANLCYTRIHSIREKKRTGGGGFSTPTSGSGTSGTLPPSGPPARPVAGTNEKPVGGVPPAGARDERGAWTGPGRLVRSALAIDGRRTYALETSPGVVTMYIVASPNYDMERFVNKKVDVYGIRNERRDVKKPFVVATAAEVVP